MTKDFASKLTSRFCHDLANPLGAIGNGLELLELSGQTKTPEMSLVSDSLAQATASLAMFRVAFGGYSEGPATSEITQSLLQIWNASGKVRLSANPDLAITNAQRKLLGLLCMCFENALPGGGIVDLEKTSSGFTLRGTGRVVKFESSLWDAIANTDTDLAAARIHFIAAGVEAKVQGATISPKAAPDQIEIILSV